MEAFKAQQKSLHESLERRIGALEVLVQAVPSCPMEVALENVEKQMASVMQMLRSRSSVSESTLATVPESVQGGCSAPPMFSGNSLDSPVPDCKGADSKEEDCTEEHADRISQLESLIKARAKETRALRRMIMVQRDSVTDTTRTEVEDLSKETEKLWAEAVSSASVHTIQETVWEAALLLFLDPVGTNDSVVSVLVMVMNICIQLLFCVVICMSIVAPQIQTAGEASMISRVRLWRETFGHRAEYANPITGRSLVSDICADSAQEGVVASEWASLLAGAEEYTAPMGPVPLGLLVNMLVQFVWLFVVLKELRASASFFNSVSAVPRGRSQVTLSTGDGSFTLRRISNRRVALVLVVISVRVGIALLLLVTGSLWLAFTEDIIDMLLNAAALAFIMDTDEHLFTTLAPTTLEVLVHKFTPLAKAIIPKEEPEQSTWLSRMQLRINPVSGERIPSSLRGILFILVFVISPYLVGFGALPMGSRYTEFVAAERELCCGDRHFVWATDADAITFTWTHNGTLQLPIPSTSDRSLWKQSVRGVIDRNATYESCEAA